MKRSDLIKIKIIISFVIYTIIIFLIIFFVFIPSVQEIQKTRKNIDKQKENLLEQDSINRNLKNTNENLEIIKYNMQNIDNIFVHENGEVEFITTLENISAKENVKQSLKIIPPKDNNIYKKTQIQLTITGNFQSILNYLAEIERLNYYINIYSIDISKNPNNTMRGLDGVENTQTNITCTINAYTYWK